MLATAPRTQPSPESIHNNSGQNSNNMPHMALKTDLQNTGLQVASSARLLTCGEARVSGLQVKAASWVVHSPVFAPARRSRVGFSFSGRACGDR